MFFHTLPDTPVSYTSVGKMIHSTEVLKMKKGSFLRKVGLGIAVLMMFVVMVWVITARWMSGGVEEGRKGNGWLRVESVPSGATVYVDGANEGSTPWEGEIEHGLRSLEVRKEGYESVKEKVRVHAKKRRTLSYALRSVRRADERPVAATTAVVNTPAATTAVVNTPAPVKDPAAGTRKTFTAAGVGFAMRWIPAGSFMMGSPSNEAGRSNDEGPQRRVKISKGFWMLESEVTQGQYKALMGKNPSWSKKCGKNCPVERVSWNDARTFANKLSQAQGLSACTARGRGIFRCVGWRLPTEAEWEYAARARTTTPFHTGYCISTNQANYYVNYPQMGCPRGKSRGKTIEVCSLARNRWGLCDMHGNVFEWVMDVYKSGYAGMPTRDPLRTSGGTGPAQRGGSWSSDAWRVRSANRNYNAPAYRFIGLGFRLLRY